MDGIKLTPKTGFSLEKTTDKANTPSKLPEIAEEFERLFALQLVSEMTKGTFKTADNAIGQAGSELYRSQINETLASSLAKQGSLGFARMLKEHWKNMEEQK